MTAQSLPRRAPARQGSVSEFAVTSCAGCSNSVRGVQVDGGTVLVDGRDPDGSVYWLKVGGKGVFRRLEPGQAPPANVVRYLEHRCPNAASVRRAESQLSTGLGAAPVGAASYGLPSLGPCAGRCGRRVTAYGGTADNPPQMMCPDCKTVLARWRALPAADRGQIPYGKWVDGRYIPRS